MSNDNRTYGKWDVPSVGGSGNRFIKNISNLYLRDYNMLLNNSPSEGFSRFINKTYTFKKWIKENVE